MRGSCILLGKYDESTLRGCEFSALGASIVGSQGVLSASGLSKALGRIARGTGSI